MFVARTEITNLKAHVEELTKSEMDFKVRYEEARSHRERVEEQQLIIKDKDLAGKDVEIGELKRHLRESLEALEVDKQKCESLEIDLEAEKSKSESIEEAR
ncbi:hypothetical protein Hanom_Chr00s040564g01774271 [Helianthus anomalus]